MRWTEEQDLKLKSLVADHGGKNWKLVSRYRLMMRKSQKGKNDHVCMCMTNRLLRAWARIERICSVFIVITKSSR